MKYNLSAFITFITFTYEWKVNPQFFDFVMEHAAQLTIIIVM